MIAIKINNPSRAASRFGECAGDYTPAECQWWIGTPRELYPSATLPDGAKLIAAPVRTCGGNAWIEHPKRTGTPSMEWRWRENNSLNRLSESCLGSLADGKPRSKEERKDVLRYARIASVRHLP